MELGIGCKFGLSEGIEDGCDRRLVKNAVAKVGVLVVLHKAAIAPMPFGVMRNVTLCTLPLVASSLQNEPVYIAVVTCALVAAIALPTDSTVSLPEKLDVLIIK